MCVRKRERERVCVCEKERKSLPKVSMSGVSQYVCSRSFSPGDSRIPRPPSSRRRAQSQQAQRLNKSGQCGTDLYDANKTHLFCNWHTFIQ